jgi:hypothetical protein
MMWAYEEVVEEEEENKLHAEVLEGWTLLVRKGGNTKRYHGFLWKLECAYLVEDDIAEFGRQHEVCGQALTDYVIGYLYKRLNSGDGGDPYYPSELEDNEEE